MSANNKEGLNLLWELVANTDPSNLKSVSNNGRSFKAIDSTSQIKKATELWGSYGKEWGLVDLNYIYKTLGDTELLVLHTMFYYPGGKFELSNAIKLAYVTQGYQGKPGYLKIDDEAYKKIETNTISKALARLGFNADVFLGKFEDNNYIQELNYAYADVPGKKLDSEKIREVQKLLKSTNTHLDSLLQTYQVKHLGQLNDKQYIDIKNKLGADNE